MDGYYSQVVKPCPFCGSDVLKITRSDYENSKWAKIECCNCHANIRNPKLTEYYEEARSQVVEAWNRRTNMQMLILRDCITDVLKLDEKAPQEVKEWLKNIKQEFKDGEHDDIILSVMSALAYKISREGL